MRNTYVYTGGYTEAKQMGSGEVVPAACPGIICFSWDDEQGTLHRESVAADAINPSWIEPDAAGEYLYSVSELQEHNGIGGSLVSAWKVDQETGSLTLLNRQATGGEDACHLMISPNGRYLVCSNYSGGSVSVFPIREDHSLGTLSCLIRHSGKGVNPERQESPHVHQALLAPDGKHLYLSDLGLDKLVCYDADWETGILTKSQWPDIPCLPGQGARHALFAQNLEYKEHAAQTEQFQAAEKEDDKATDRFDTVCMLYQMTEMGCAVNAYTYDPATGTADLVQTISAMDEGFTSEGSLGAAIHLHPNGKWLYVSVRGTNSDHDRLILFHIQADGTLVKKQSLYAGGKIPRDFSLTDDGAWLLCGTADSDTITVFAIDPEDGTLREHSSTHEAGGVTRVAVKYFRPKVIAKTV